jgi:hypothetical protein
MKLLELLASSKLPVSTQKHYFYAYSGQVFYASLLNLGKNRNGHPLILCATCNPSEPNDVAYGVLKVIDRVYEATAIVTAPNVAIGFDQIIRCLALEKISGYFPSLYEDLDVFESERDAEEFLKCFEVVAEAKAAAEAK